VPSRAVGETIRPARVGVARGRVADGIGIGSSVAVNDGWGVELGQITGARVAVPVSAGESNAVDA
jgi:hypothetical protein